MSGRRGFKPHGVVEQHAAEMDELTSRMRMAAARMRCHSAGSAEVEDRNRRLALAEGAALSEEMKTWRNAPRSSSRNPRASATTTPA